MPLAILARGYIKVILKPLEGGYIMAYYTATMNQYLCDDRGNNISVQIYEGEMVQLEYIGFIDTTLGKLYKITEFKSVNNPLRNYGSPANVVGNYIRIYYKNKPSGPMINLRESTSNEVYLATSLTDKNGNPFTNESQSPNDERLQLVEYTESRSYKRLTETLAQTTSSGLRIQHLKGILGIPHQFSPIADTRVTGNIFSNDGLGRLYVQFIVKNMPLLIITPGVPKFMGSAGDTDRRNMLAKLAEATMEGLGQLFGDSKAENTYSGKYYTLDYKYTEYFKYVNVMLRSAAVFLGISEENYHGSSLGSMNWLFNVDQTNSHDVGWLRSFVGNHFGHDCIFLYANVGESTSDTFTNSTTQSQLANTLNSYSDKFREMNFMLGTGKAVFGENSQGDIIGDYANSIPSDSILSKAKTILSGGRLEFPEIWSDSQFGRSYNATMKLISPYGDKLSVFLNILVPIYHVLALALPVHDQSGIQGYVSPFLIRAYYKGIFNVDLGIISSLSINKGSEGEWTRDGIPTVAELSFEIKDLYDGFFMSQGGVFGIVGKTSIFTNVTELDYIANSCGINVNAMEITRLTDWYWRMFTGAIKDTLEISIWGRIGEALNNLSFLRIFEFFRS